MTVKQTVRQMQRSHVRTQDERWIGHNQPISCSASNCEGRAASLSFPSYRGGEERERTHHVGDPVGDRIDMRAVWAYHRALLNVDLAAGMCRGHGPEGAERGGRRFFHGRGDEKSGGTSKEEGRGEQASRAPRERV